MEDDKLIGQLKSELIRQLDSQIANSFNLTEEQWARLDEIREEIISMYKERETNNPKTFITNIRREDYNSNELQMFFDQNGQFWVTDDATDAYGRPIPYSLAVHTTNGMGSEDARYFGMFMRLYLNIK